MTMRSPADAIAGIESRGSGNYAALGPWTKGDRAYGRYQVMGSNIAPWTQMHLGRQLTPEEFIASPEAQDAVFKGEFGKYEKKYGPEGAARAWFAGEGNMNNMKAKDVLGTSVADYQAKFSNAMGLPSAPGALTDVSAQSSNSGALSPDNTMGAGILANGSEPEVNKAQVIGNGLTGVGSALAGITSPQQAQALNQQLVATQKAAVDKGWSVSHVDPKTGMAVLSRKDGTLVSRKVFNPKADASEDHYVKKAQEEQAKSMQEFGVKISDAATNAAGQATTVAEIKNALSNPAVYQGTGGEWVHPIRKLYASMGFGDASAVADGDIVKALGNKLALQLVQDHGQGKLLPGSFSDSDRAFVKEMSTGLNNSHEANIRLLDIYERANTRALEAEAARQKHIEANSGIMRPEFRAELGQMQQRWANEDRQRPAFNAPSSVAPTKRPPLNSIFK